MATIKAPSWHTDHMQGTFGDSCSAHLFVDLAAAPVDTEVLLGKFRPGYRVDDMKVVNEALGASTGLKIGFKPKGGGAADDDYFATIAGTSSAKTTRSNAAPKAFEVETEVTLTVTGGAATGRVDIVMSGVFVGV